MAQRALVVKGHLRYRLTGDDPTHGDLLRFRQDQDRHGIASLTSCPEASSPSVQPNETGGK